MAAPAIHQQQQQQQLLPDTTSIPGYIILPEPDENAPQAAAPPRTAVHPLGEFDLRAQRLDVLDSPKG